MKLEALKDNVVLRPIMADSQSKGGIMLPERSRERFEDGAEVISIGPLVTDLAIGDIVVRPDPPRYEIIDDNANEIQWISAEEDILAKVVGETDAVEILKKKWYLHDKKE